MSDKLRLNDEELKGVSGGVNNRSDLILKDFYTVSGESDKLFRVDYINPCGSTIICGIFDYNSKTKTATNTRSSTTNYSHTDLTHHDTPDNIIE